MQYRIQKALLLGCSIGASYLYSMEAVEQPKAVVISLEGSGRSFALNNTCTKIYIGTTKGKLLIMDLTRGKTLKEMGCYDSIVMAVAVSPDEKKLFTSSTGSKNACLWNAQTEGILLEFNEIKSIVHCAQFSADGHQLLTLLLDNTAFLWNITADQPELVTSFEGKILVAQLHPDGKTIFLGNAEGSIYSMDIASKQILNEFKGPMSRPYGLTLSSTGEKMVTAVDRTARVWDTKKATQLVTVADDLPGPMVATRLSADGNYLLTGNLLGVVGLWNASTGEKLDSYRLSPKQNSIRFVSFTPDSTCALIGSDEGFAVWDYLKKSCDAPANPSDFQATQTTTVLQTECTVQ